MRTTIDIPDELYREVRAKSAMSGVTLRAVTITLYTDWLAARAPQCRAKPKDSSMPSWAGLCAKHAASDQSRKCDMESIRDSIGLGIARERA